MKKNFWYFLSNALFLVILLLFLPYRTFAQSFPFYCVGGSNCSHSGITTPTTHALLQQQGNPTISTTARPINITTNLSKEKNNKDHDNRSRQSRLSFLQRLLDMMRKLWNNPPPTPVPPMPSMPMPTGIPADATSIDAFQYTPGNEPLKTFDLTAEVVGGQWTFNGIVPGPEIRVNQGDHVRVILHNNLPAATSIHWHGIRIFASQDGVPGVTQNAVQPGHVYTYDFVVPDAGTYWYHTHQDTLNQLPLGLYGSLIVLPLQASVQYDRDYTVQYRNTTASASGSTVTLSALPGEKVRLRLINSRAGDFTGAPVTAALIGAPFKVIALDGHDINAPQIIQNQLLPIGMSQRYDLEFIMPISGSVRLVELDKIQTVTLGYGVVISAPELNTLPTFNYINYGLPAPDPRLPSGTFDVNYTLTVGANLSINGQIYPNVPDLVIKQGQLVHIHFVNNSNFTHPMHLHGHIFSVLKRNEVPLTGSPIHLDTILIPPLQTADVAFIADDPGIWMLHCHVLAHAASGLMMMVKYDNVYTPYQIGPASGNIPE